MTPEQFAATHQAAFGQKGWSAEYIAKLSGAAGTTIYGEPGSFAIVRRAADEAEILTIATHPHVQGTGLATRTLASAIAGEAGRGTRALFLEVAADNTPALRLYARAGFRRIAERKDYYRSPDGRCVTALVMRKNIGPMSAQGS